MTVLDVDDVWERTDLLDELHEAWIEQGWADAADGMNAVFLLASTHRLVVNRVEAVVRPLGLTFAGYALLAKLALSPEETISIAHLADILQVHPTSVSSTLARLESARLVERRPHPVDRRKILVRITSSGRARAAKTTDLLNATVFSWLPVAEHDLARIWAVLRSLRANAGDFAGVDARTRPPVERRQPRGA
jgi:DNA-binding MarR family transcriptional regulator